MSNPTVYEDVDFHEFVDALNEPIPGLPIVGRGRLLVWDLEPEANLAHAHIYVAIRADGNITRKRNWVAVTHDWPPKLEAK